MKIVHVVAGLEAVNGMAVVVRGLARAECEMGHEVVVVSTRPAGGGACPETPCARQKIFVRSAAPLLRDICFSSALLRGLPRICCDADIVHVHGAWTFPVWWGVRCAVRAGCRVVLTPHGGYDPVRIAYGAWKKRLVAGLDRRCLRAATLVQATSAEEDGWVRKFEPGVRRIAVVSPGVSAPPQAVPLVRHAPLHVLYLGRRHPLKGLDLLEKAVEGLDVDLKIADTATGEERERLFAWCDLLVLPTRSENFGLVVAEALVRGRPVVVTRAAPWRELTVRRCGWVTDVSSESLRTALLDARNAPLEEMGARGREWMLADFRWADRARDLLEAIGA